MLPKLGVASSDLVARSSIFYLMTATSSDSYPAEVLVFLGEITTATLPIPFHRYSRPKPTTPESAHPLVQAPTTAEPDPWPV